MRSPEFNSQPQRNLSSYLVNKLRELAQVDDDRWDEIINEPTPRPKLQAFIEKATAEGSEPLDLNRM